MSLHDIETTERGMYGKPEKEKFESNVYSSPRSSRLWYIVVHLHSFEEIRDSSREIHADLPQDVCVLIEQQIYRLPVSQSELLLKDTVVFILQCLRNSDILHQTPATELSEISATELSVHLMQKASWHGNRRQSPMHFEQTKSDNASASATHERVILWLNDEPSWDRKTERGEYY